MFTHSHPADLLQLISPWEICPLSNGKIQYQVGLHSHFWWCRARHQSNVLHPYCDSRALVQPDSWSTYDRVKWWQFWYYDWGKVLGRLACGHWVVARCDREIGFWWNDGGVRFRRVPWDFEVKNTPCISVHFKETEIWGGFVCFINVGLDLLDSDVRSQMPKKVYQDNAKREFNRPSA